MKNYVTVYNGENTENEVKIPSRANILLIGNSGAGKSTLINAVFDKRVSGTGRFGGGFTQNISTYENEKLNYRVIDTKGLELGKMEQRDTFRQIKRYISDLIKAGDTEASIDVIWYCVDATSKRFFEQNVKQIMKVYRNFPNAPVIITLTKSFGPEFERLQNINDISEAFAKYDPGRKIYLADIIPVNSEPFPTATGDIIPIFGLDKLVDRTNEIIPIAKKTSAENMKIAVDNMRMRQSNITVMSATILSVVVGAVPIPIPDATILTPLQTGMTKGITKIYNIPSDVIVTAILEASVVTFTARTVLAALKAIPGINVAASVLNAIVAGVFTMAIGQASIFVCKKISNGEMDPENLEDIKETITKHATAVMSRIMPQVEDEISQKGSGNMTIDDVKSMMRNILKKDKKNN